MQVSRVFICCMPQVPPVAIKYAKIHITDARLSNFPREKQAGREEEGGGGAVANGCSGLQKGSAVCACYTLAATCKLSHSSVYTGKVHISVLIPPSLSSACFHLLLLFPLLAHSPLVCSWHSPPSRCAYLGA